MVHPKIGESRKPSLQQQWIAERKALLASYRRTYLRMIAIELCMPNLSLRDVALREIGELTLLVQELTPEAKPE